MKMLKALAIAVMAAWLAACATDGTRDGDVAVEDRGSEAAGSGEASTSGVGDYGDLSLESLNDPDSPLSQRVIYFAYDSSDVAEEDRDLIAAHASVLSSNPQLTVTLEGHTDERGSREYNVGLGDRRAQAIRRMLEFQGVSPSQINTVSYGEEKPAVEGHDESAWSLNRRVELVYAGY